MEISLIPESYYNHDHEFGLYYNIGCFSWDELITEDQDEGMWICLCYKLPDKMPKYQKQKIEKWEAEVLNILDKIKPTLLEKYHVYPNPSL